MTDEERLALVLRRSRRASKALDTALELARRRLAEFQVALEQYTKEFN